MFKTTKALVLRQVRYKEADFILTVLTETDGVITVKARGALRRSSRIAGASQLLCYSEMTLFQNKGKWILNEAAVLEDFSGLRQDIAALALGAYFAEALEALLQEGVCDLAAMQLGLNSLYALSRRLYDPRLIKAAFELRLMCLEGYEPDLRSCAVCGEEKPVEPAFHVDGGIISCKACRRNIAGESVLITEQTLNAMRYISCAEAKKLLSYPIEGLDLERLALACERYFLTRAERRFGSLDYWNKVKP